MPGETGNLQQMGLLGVVCEVADLHVVQHALAEQCHGVPPGNSGWHARSGTSMLLLAACSSLPRGSASDNHPDRTRGTDLRFPPTIASAV